MSDSDPTPSPSARERGSSQDPTVTSQAGPRFPAVIGDFRILRKLGEGGMGVVYEAEQQHPKRPVALKVIRGGVYVDDSRVRLFQREAQTLARLKHPYIAAIYESGRTEDGHHFFAMELIRGESLTEYIKRHTTQGIDRNTLRTRLGLFCKICDGLSYAHQRGVIHRDLKPANILIPRETAVAASPAVPAVPDVKILDFGLARITDSDIAVSTMVTSLGQMFGTIPYMSPEQVRGNPDEIDLRTDVYSLGVVLYELISGRLPYELDRTSLPEATRVICEQEPGPLDHRGTGHVDSDVVTIVRKSLEKEPARRYQSAAAFADDIQRYLTDQPILARPPSATYHLRKLVARHKAPFGLAAALLLLLVAFGATMTVQAGRIARERDRANRERDRANREARASQNVSGFLTDLFRVSDPSESRGNTVTAREILDRGAERIDHELRAQPVLRAELMHTMANVYSGLGLPDHAGPLFERSVAVLEDSLPGSAELARSLGDLGTFYAWHGRVQDALPLLRRSLAIRRQVSPPGAPSIAHGMAGIANYYLAIGNHDSALTYYQEATALLEHTTDLQDRRYLSWYWNDLGLSRVAVRDFAGARIDLERALKIKQSILPAGDPDIGITAGNLGFLMARMGQFDEARPILEDILLQREKIFGPDHPLTAEALAALGEMCWRKGDFTKALPYALRAVEIQDTRPPGPDLVSLYILAATLHEQGRYRESEAYFERAIALHDQAAASGANALNASGAITVPLNGVEWGECVREYVKLLRKTGRRQEATAVESRYAATIRRGAEPSSHP